MSISAPDVKNWYCVRSTVGYEARAAELLSKLTPDIQSSVGDLEVYCPQIRKFMHVGGKKRIVLAPLFPGYFFAKFCFETASRYVSSRPGVIGLVRFGDQAATVGIEVIQELQLTYSEAKPLLVVNAFTFGQEVIIREGPFAGMEAEYISSLGDGRRALLLLEYLHRRVNVVADCKILEPAA